MSSHTVMHILYIHCVHIMFSYIIVGTCLSSYTLKSVITRTCVYSDRLAGALYIDDYDGEQCQCSDSYTKYRAPATGQYTCQGSKYLRVQVYLVNLTVLIFIIH